jgi:hypothetical protein
MLLHHTNTLLTILCIQKADGWDQPLTDQFAKEGKDKMVTFTCRFNKAITGEAKWSFKQEVSSSDTVYIYIYIYIYIKNTRAN